MESPTIRKLSKEEKVPYRLLHLADPSTEAVGDYLKRGECFICSISKKIIGIYVLLPTRPFTIELVNLAVDEEYQNMGYGKNLIANAIETARNAGYKVMEVGTGDAGIGQLALYQKCGFSMDYIDHDFFRKHYPEPIFENGIECRHMVRLKMDL